MGAALITGGAGRLGAAIAAKFAAEGRLAIIADKNAAAARDLASRLGPGTVAAPGSFDIVDLDATKAQVSDLVSRHGPIDALVNVAGGRTGAGVGLFTELDESHWKPLVDLHLRGVFNILQAVLPQMIERKKGSIILLAAVEGLRSDISSAVFSTAKAGVIVLVEALVRELQPQGVRVNCIVPGTPETLSAAGLVDDSAEVAEAVAFLASERARLTTGACFDVSNGIALH